MKKLKRDEVHWQSLKLLANGGMGIESKYSYFKDVQNRKMIRTISAGDDTLPHDDYKKVFKSFALIVAKVEEYDYIRQVTGNPDFEATDRQMQFAQAAVSEKIGKITVTRIDISEKKKVFGVVIHYEKDDAKDNTTSHKTNWIGTGDIEYGVEEELAELIEDLKKEAYNYEFEGKCANYEQLTFNLSDDEQEPEEKLTEAEEVD